MRAVRPCAYTCAFDTGAIKPLKSPKTPSASRPRSGRGHQSRARGRVGVPEGGRSRTGDSRPGPGHSRPGPARSRLIIFNKPFGVLTKFTDEQGRATLGDYLTVPDVYPAGRLDRNSEGLLLLTNDGRLQARIAEPRYQMAKTYWAQVEGSPAQDQLDRLRNGVMLKDGMTLPAQVDAIDEPELWLRDPPIRFRAAIPTAWLRITITEGRNRQVRRMTAAVGLPTLRLVRVRVGPWELGALQPGQWSELPFPAKLLAK